MSTVSSASSESNSILTDSVSSDKPSGSRTIVMTNPATGEWLGVVPALTEDEVQQRLQRARAAQAHWKRTPLSERRLVLARVLQIVLDRADELCRIIATETGKTLQNAMMGEIWPVCEKLRYVIDKGEEVLRPQRVSPGLLVQKHAQIEYHPLGVIGAIIPWNFPLQNIMNPTIPALMAGNAMMCKVSEWSSYSAAPVQEIFHAALESRGHPSDLVQLLTGYGETGAALVRSGVDKLFFVGSTNTGRQIILNSAQNITPVVLELGGKDPFLVCEDADVDRAIASALNGVFMSAGQMCQAAERFYVHTKVHDEFVAAAVREVRCLRQGPPLSGADASVDVGAMTMPHQVDIVDRLVQDAVKKGAHVQCGGARVPGTRQFYKPTILTEADHSMAIMHEETFGPVMVIMRVQSDNEAVKLANESSFGLGSTVFTRDRARGQRLAAELQAGSTCINDHALNYMVQALPFGGLKQSGFGRVNGADGLRACTNIKAVLSDRLPMGMPTRVYPVSPGQYESVHFMMELIYRPVNWDGLKARARALRNLVSTLRLPERSRA